MLLATMQETPAKIKCCLCNWILEGKKARKLISKADDKYIMREADLLTHLRGQHGRVMISKEEKKNTILYLGPKYRNEIR